MYRERFAHLAILVGQLPVGCSKLAQIGRNDSVDLAGYAEIIADLQREKFEDATFEPLEPRVIHGMQALVRELRGTLKGLNLVYLSAVVETPKHFVQIQTWTSKSRFEASRPVLLSVIDSFDVIGPKPN